MACSSGKVLWFAMACTFHKLHAFDKACMPDKGCMSGKVLHDEVACISRKVLFDKASTSGKPYKPGKVFVVADILSNTKNFSSMDSWLEYTS